MKRIKQYGSEAGALLACCASDAACAQLIAPDLPYTYAEVIYACRHEMALRLEDTWDHPDNRGWQELFKTWARAEVVREAWELSRETYGIRFRHFCERKLGLPVVKATGSPRVAPKSLPPM